MESKYVPLVAAGISGACSLLGIVVGALVLRHQLRSQVNPFALEFFKRQCEVLTAVMRGTQDCVGAVQKCVHDPSEANRNAVLGARAKLHETCYSNSLWIPSDIVKGYARLAGQVGLFMRAVGAADMAGQGGARQQVDKEAMEMFQACRDALHIYHLGEAFKKLASSHPVGQPVRSAAAGDDSADPRAPL